MKKVTMHFVLLFFSLYLSAQTKEIRYLPGRRYTVELHLFDGFILGLTISKYDYPDEGLTNLFEPHRHIET
jgi:hypothetical protein